jgi:hypothetical protein
VTSLEDLDARVRVIERELAERAYVLNECATLRERVGSLEVQVHPLLTLSNQLTALATQLNDLKTELAAFKGRAIGIVTAVSFVAPVVASGLTAWILKILHVGAL